MDTSKFIPSLTVWNRQWKRMEIIQISGFNELNKQKKKQTTTPWRLSGKNSRKPTPKFFKIGIDCKGKGRIPDSCHQI